MERGCPQSRRGRGLTMLLITLAGTIKAIVNGTMIPLARMETICSDLAVATIVDLPVQ
jgi:hypothetical protein